jgi:hypothetical protein
MLGLVVALGTLATSAQDNTIPLKQIEKDAQNLQLSARAAVPDNEAAVEHGNALRLVFFRGRACPSGSRPQVSANSQSGLLPA